VTRRRYKYIPNHAHMETCLFLSSSHVSRQEVLTFRRDAAARGQVVLHAGYSSVAGASKPRQSTVMSDGDIERIIGG